MPDNSKTRKCPACDHILYRDKGTTWTGLFRHHLWGGHKVDIARAHKLGEIFADDTQTEQDIDEVKQMRIPGI